MHVLNTLRACGALFRVKLAESVQYRLAALSRVAVSLLYGLMICVLYLAYYRHGDAAAAGGFTLACAISYTWLAQSLYGLMDLSLDGEIDELLEKGNVAVELCRPLDLYWHWYARTAAGKLGNNWGRCLGTLAVSLLLPGILRLGPPASLLGLLLALAGLVLGFLLSTAFTLLLCAVRMNISWGRGPVHMIQCVGQLLAGLLLPLALWPDGLQPLLRLTPFAGMLDTPLQLYLGTLPPAAAPGALGLSAGWLVVLVLLGRGVMKRRMKTLIVQGG